MEDEKQEAKLDQEEESNEDNLIPEYSSKSDFSKGLITQEAIKKCLALRSEEMKKGYFNFVMTDNQWNKIWITDTRDKYVSSVIALKQLLTPEIGRDEKTKTALSTIDKEIKTIFDTFAYSPYKQEKEKTRGLPMFKIDEKKKYIPVMESVVKVPQFDARQNQNLLTEIKGGWDDKINAYKDGLVVIYDKVFAELNVLVDTLNYFKKTSSWAK